MLKQETQRPAAIASLPVVPRKRCIFNIHCPKKQQQQKQVPVGSAEVPQWLEYEHGKPPPPSNTPLVIGPKGAYFRPEGTGGKYIAGISPLESEVRFHLN
jgi:hypothetical protein